MADTQEFNNLVFDVSRFSDELMEELHATCPSQMKINGRALIIKHLQWRIFALVDLKPLMKKWRM